MVKSASGPYVLNRMMMEFVSSERLDKLVEKFRAFLRRFQREKLVEL